MTTASLPYMDIIEHQVSRHSSISSVLSHCADYPRSVRIPSEPYAHQLDQLRESHKDLVCSPRRSASLARHRDRRQRQDEEDGRRNIPYSTTDRRSHCLPVSCQPRCMDTGSGPRLSTQNYDARDRISKERGGRKILSFFQRGFNTKRPKSATKLGRKNIPDGYSGSQDSLGSLLSEYECEASPTDALTLLAKQISVLPDHLLSESTHHLEETQRQKETINVPNRSHIYPIDSSLVNASKNHCFQVVSETTLPTVIPLTPDAEPPLSLGRTVRSTSDMPRVSCEGTELYEGQRRTYGCCSVVERNRWMLHLKRLMRPTLDAERRRENCLHVWVQEAKGLIGRHKYHCEVLLDGTPCARTTSKRLTDMLFWGEEFDLSGLPDFGTLSVELWIDSESGDDCTTTKTTRHRTVSSQSSAPRHVNGAPQIKQSVMACARGTDNRLQERECPTKEDATAQTHGTEHGMYGHRSKTSSPITKGGSRTVSLKTTARRDKWKCEKHSTHSSLIATVIIPKSNLLTAMEVENWYPVAYHEGGISRKRSDHSDYWSGKGRSGKREPSSPDESFRTIQLRIKTRYRSVVVLPLVSYSRLQSQLAQFQPPQAARTSDEPTQSDSALFLSNLDPWLSVKSKAELAGSIVALHQALRQTTDFLAVLILHEVYKQADPNMVLRGNSIATKATEIYLRLVGETYLPIILSDFVHAVSGGTRKASDQIEQVPVKTSKHLRHTATVVPSEVSNVDCEVDTARVQNSALLASNQANLLRLVQMVWEKIIASEPHFPNQLRLLFATVRQHLDVTFPNDNARNQIGTSAPHASMAEHVISACLFLRYICPAILSPSLFGLAPEFPSDPKVLRAFTLVAKAIQSLANFSLFTGSKEVYMTFMNQFVMEQLPSMRQFLRAISTPNPTLRRSIRPCVGDSDVPNDTHRLLNSHSHHGVFGGAERRDLEHQSLLTRSTSGMSSTPNPTQSLSRDVFENGNAFETRRFREPIMLPPLPNNSPSLNNECPAGDHIDLALCLALCHCQLSEALSKVPADKMVPLGSKLKPILEEIDFFLVSGVEPNPNWWLSSHQSGAEEKTPTANGPKNNALLKYHTPHATTSGNRSDFMVYSKLNEPVHAEQREIWKPVNDLISHSEPHEMFLSRQTTEDETVGLFGRQKDREIQARLATAPEKPIVPITKYVQRPILTNRNQITTSTLTDYETNNPKEEVCGMSASVILCDKMLQVKHTPPSRVKAQHALPPYVLPPVYLSRENPRRNRDQAHQTMGEGERLEGVPWSIEMKRGQILKGQAVCPRDKQSVPPDKTQKENSVPLDHTSITLLSSPDHESLESQEIIGHSTSETESVAVDAVENGSRLKGQVHSRDPCTETLAMNNPLYVFHARTPEMLERCHLGSMPGSPVKQAGSESSPILQTAPSRSKSFTDQHMPPRHTYVNLTENNITTEVVLSPIRDERCSEDIAPHLVETPGLKDGCCILETSATDCSSIEASSISVPLRERRGSNSSDSSRRTIVTLERYAPRPYCSFSDGSRSIGHNATERLTLTQSEPVNNVSIQRELDASNARLAEAQARLLANEAERIQLLRAWHNELMRQSQLTGYTSWGPSTVNRQLAKLTQKTDQTNAIGGPVISHSASIDPSLRATASPMPSTTASYSTTRIHRSMYSTKPRMGASVISATYQESPDVDQSSLPRGRVLNAKQPMPWVGDQYTSDLRVAMVRSPSSPGLLSGTEVPVTKTRHAEFSVNQSFPDMDSEISTCLTTDRTNLKDFK